MKKLYTKPLYIGKFYGVELEIEAEGLYQPIEEYNEEEDEHLLTCPPIPQGWLREDEDSILGVELISSQPYSYEEQIENIVRVFTDIEKKGYRPTRTPRGSTHVHANVSDLTWEQLTHFVMACIWAEPLLIEIAGKGRKGNLFAQSYETTPIGWDNIISWCKNQTTRFTRTLDTHYMATSFYPITSMGSVEFRMGPSSRNAKEACNWLEMIDSVVSAGRTLPIDGETIPSFVYFLLEFIPYHKRGRLLEKCQKFAKEVWDLIHEAKVELPKDRNKDVPVLNPYILDFEDVIHMENIPTTNETIQAFLNGSTVATNWPNSIYALGNT